MWGVWLCKNITGMAIVRLTSGPARRPRTAHFWNYFTATSVFKTDQWSLFKQEVEVRSFYMQMGRPEPPGRPAGQPYYSHAGDVFTQPHSSHTGPPKLLQTAHLHFLHGGDVMNTEMLKEKWSYITNFFFFKTFWWTVYFWNNILVFILYLLGSKD